LISLTSFQWTVSIMTSAPSPLAGSASTIVLGRAIP
jgi:hypothetical protein